MNYFSGLPENQKNSGSTGACLRFLVSRNKEKMVHLDHFFNLRLRMA
ncbi:hypothetical protein HMPREF1557_01217 [Streptococcus sobrinus W1703]|uniref:Uncharacterized protein n=1 Tax=Streptococcus sobrinus W1703 TaxID=1227275 RepID=U2IQE3_9STRE|nr:hypothetical protein HMPREF1557_01217 [Streptococcus sobrinus W1703]